MAASSPRPSRARRRAQRVEAIVDAALVIITTEGFDALTMTRLARELGYATGAFYRYFRSKDELLLATQRRVLEQLAQDLHEALEAAEPELAALPERTAALARILVGAGTYASLPRRRPAQFRLLARWLGEPEPMVPTEVAQPLLPALVGLFARIPPLFARAAEIGALSPGDPTRRTYLLWTSLSGVQQLLKLERFGVEALQVDPLTQTLLETLLTGWGAAAPHLPDALAFARRSAAPGESA